jgi:hypothetical protein
VCCPDGRGPADGDCRTDGVERRSQALIDDLKLWFWFERGSQTLVQKVLVQLGRDKR